MRLSRGVLDLSRKAVHLRAIADFAQSPRASSISRLGWGYGLNVTVHIRPAKSGLKASGVSTAGAGGHDLLDQSSPRNRVARS